MIGCDIIFRPYGHLSVINELNNTFLASCLESEVWVSSPPVQFYVTLEDRQVSSFASSVHYE